jgi:hypothetical protein
VTALIARPGRRQLALAGLVLFLYVVQTILPPLRAASVAVAALHPVNALLLFAVAVVVARRATAMARSAERLTAG